MLEVRKPGLWRFKSGVPSSTLDSTQDPVPLHTGLAEPGEHLHHVLDAQLFIIHSLQVRIRLLLYLGGVPFTGAQAIRGRGTSRAHQGGQTGGCSNCVGEQALEAVCSAMRGKAGQYLDIEENTCDSPAMSVSTRHLVSAQVLSQADERVESANGYNLHLQDS